MVLETQSAIPGDRIKIVFDRVVTSEIILSLVSFPIVFLALNLKKDGIKSINIILSILTIALQIVLLLYLKTRTSWIAYLIVFILLIYFVLKFYKREINYKKALLSLLLIIFISGIIYAVIPEHKGQERRSISTTFSSIIDKDYYTNKSRINFWKASLKMFVESPFIGIGHGNWPGFYPKYDGYSYTDATVSMNSAVNPHNEYLEILAEHGLMGFVIFTGFISTGLYFLLKNTKNNFLYTPFALSAAGIIVAMFFSFPAENIWAYSVFVISLAVGYSEIYNTYTNKHSALKYFVITIGLTLFALGAWFGIMKYVNEKTYLEAIQLKAKGQYSEMLEKLNDVSGVYYKIDMNKMPVDFYRGVGNFELGQYNEALVKFRSARKLMKYYPVIMNNEAGAYYMLGDSKKAEEQYLEIKSLFPDYIEPQINLLALYTNERRYEDALNLMHELENKILSMKYIKNYSVFLQIKDYLKINFEDKK